MIIRKLDDLIVVGFKLDSTYGIDINPEIAFLSIRCPSSYIKGCCVDNNNVFDSVCHVWTFQTIENVNEVETLVNFISKEEIVKFIEYFLNETGVSLDGTNLCKVKLNNIDFVLSSITTHND